MTAATRSQRAPTRFAALAGVLLLVCLFVLPLRPPPSERRQLLLSAATGTVKRQVIGSRYSSGRGALLPYLPRRVLLESRGAPVRAYLLDLSRLQGADRVAAFLKATEEVERGAEPTTAPVARSVRGVTQARFDLHAWPGRGIPGRSSDATRYVLILAKDGPGAGTEAEVTIETVYR
jgi:hypothetical protein